VTDDRRQQPDRRADVVARILASGERYDEIAGRSQVSVATIADIMQGRGNQKPATIAKLLAVLERRTGDERRAEPRGTDRRGGWPKVPCPVCGSCQSIVLPYRPRREIEDCFSRVRKCEHGHRYETIEQISPLQPVRKNI
jgi:transcriptional regulator with XRE-family HTH domain